MPTYKDEKTGLWYCKFVYTDWTGTKKQKKKKGFRLQKEAKQYELDFLSKTSNSCDMLFSDMLCANPVPTAQRCNGGSVQEAAEG